jgi:hypothetical protein
VARSEQRSATKLSVAEILKRNAAAVVKRYRSQTPPQVQSTLAKLSLCRTAALGARKYRCRCESLKIVYNSCGDRHCPSCSGARRSNWLESTRELIIDGVDHFQVVFTLPDRLSSLALGNRRELYDLLFASSWKTLRRTIVEEHGYDPAALVVLHTGNQKLEAHPHVHAVVPGCGPAIDGSGIAVAMKDGNPATIGTYLVDAEILRDAFRDAFIAGLRSLYRRKKLKLGGRFEHLQQAEAWDSFLAELEAISWVSFIQPPPKTGKDRVAQTADNVLKYLARYLSGGPIADSRIVSSDDQSVTFLARAGDVSGGDAKQVPIRLSQLEFTRRWCLHILPSGYTRTRRFGGWSNTRRKAYLTRFEVLLKKSDVLSPPATDSALPDESQATFPSPENTDASDHGTCPTCGAALIPHSESRKPSWRSVMSSPDRPHWYQRF